MSRQLPRSTSIAAALSAALAVALMLLLVVAGKEDPTEAGADDATSSEGTPELSDGFRAIPGDELFATISAAQREAASWEVSSVAKTPQGELPAALQQIQFVGDRTSIRMQMQAEGKPVEGLWIDDVFYIKGLNPAKWAPWYQMPDTENTLSFSKSMVDSSTAESLIQLGEPAAYEVIGVEEVTELDDDALKAVHYRATVDPSKLTGGQPLPGETPPSLVIDLWVDSEDRPVQIRTDLVSQGQAVTTTLFFSDYGKDFEFVAPAKSEVTTKQPPAMRG